MAQTTVRSGDNMSKIAREMGVSLGSLMAANPGINVHLIHPGQKLNVPGKRSLSSKDNAKQMARMVGQAGFRTTEEIKGGMSLSQAFARDDVYAPANLDEYISGVPGYGGPSAAADTAPDYASILNVPLGQRSPTGTAEQILSGYDARGMPDYRSETRPIQGPSGTRPGAAQPAAPIGMPAPQLPREERGKFWRNVYYGAKSIKEAVSALFDPAYNPTDFSRRGSYTAGTTVPSSRAERRYSGMYPTTVAPTSGTPPSSAPSEDINLMQGDDAFIRMVKNTMQYHEQRGTPITKEEAMERVTRTSEGFHPTLNDKNGDPVRMIDAVMDPNSPAYREEEAQMWMRRISNQQAWTTFTDPVTGREVQVREPNTVKENELEVIGRNITRVMEVARQGSGGDPDAIRDAMPDVTSFEGIAKAAELMGMDPYEFLAQWEYGPLDPAGNVWQKKEPGSGAPSTAYSPPARSYGGGGGGGYRSSAPYGSAQKLAFDWRVRIT